MSLSAGSSKFSTTVDESDLTLARSFGEDLSVRRMGFQFCDAAVEQTYKEWRTATAIPFSRVGYMGSIPSWLALLGVTIWLVPEATNLAAWGVLSWVTVLLLLTSLTFWDATKAWTTPLAAAANGVAGFLVAWLVYEIAAQGMPVAARAGLLTGAVLVVMYFGFAIFRISPFQACLFITPYLVFSLYYLWSDFQGDSLSLVEAGAFSAVLFVAYFGGLFVCAIIEIVTRKTFVKDEIIRLQKRQLAESRDRIRRYVPPSVAQHIICGDMDSVGAPQRCDVTILFCDIVGFTEIADQVSPDFVTQVLGEYLYTMAEVVDHHGGLVNEFAGDGFMALFGAPDPVPLHEQAVRAVAAGLEIQGRMPGLNRKWVKEELSAEMSVRIGINTGTASVGSYGSQGRMTYTAVGIETNIAARIESKARPGEVWVSGATRNLAKDQARFSSRGQLQCKGISHPIDAFCAESLLSPAYC